jgi:STIP1 family protein 1
VDLAKEQKLNYGDEMTSILRQARKKRFQIKEEQRINQEIELQSYLNELITLDAEKNLVQLKEKQCQGNDENNEYREDDSMTESKLASIRLEIEEKRDTSITRLNDLFAKVDDNRRVNLI